MSADTGYDDKGRSLSYTDTAMKNNRYSAAGPYDPTATGALAETIVTWRETTEYDTGLEGTGRELGYDQYTYSTGSTALITQVTREDVTYSAGRIYSYTDGSFKYDNTDGISGTDYRYGAADGLEYNITTTTTRDQTEYGDYGLVRYYLQSTVDDIVDASVGLMTTVARTTYDYDFKGRSEVYTEVTMKETDPTVTASAGTLDEVSTVWRTGTTYDYDYAGGIWGTGRELGYVQYAASDTSPDIVTRMSRSDMTYENARSCTYTEAVWKYDNTDGIAGTDYECGGADGLLYNITSTTDRQDTGYNMYGLVDYYEQESHDDTTATLVTTHVVREVDDFDIKGRTKVYNEVSRRYSIDGVIDETTTTHRTRTVYDTANTAAQSESELAYFGMTITGNINGTGRELGYEQYVIRSTAEDVVTWQQRSDTTYSAGKSYGYVDWSYKYNNTDGITGTAYQCSGYMPTDTARHSPIDTGVDGGLYNLETTTTRERTTYQGYGLEDTYRNVSWGDNGRSTEEVDSSEYNINGKKDAYHSLSVSNGSMTETWRLGTGFEIHGLENTSTTLRSTSGGEVLTVRMETTYTASSSSRVYGYVDVVHNADLTTTTTREETFYDRFGLTASYHETGIEVDAAKPGITKYTETWRGGFVNVTGTDMPAEMSQISDPVDYDIHGRTSSYVQIDHAWNDVASGDDFLNKWTMSERLYTNYFDIFYSAAASAWLVDDTLVSYDSTATVGHFVGGQSGYRDKRTEKAFSPTSTVVLDKVSTTTRSDMTCFVQDYDMTASVGGLAGLQYGYTDIIENDYEAVQTEGTRDYTLYYTVTDTASGMFEGLAAEYRDTRRRYDTVTGSYFDSTSTTTRSDITYYGTMSIPPGEIRKAESGYHEETVSLANGTSSVTRSNILYASRNRQKSYVEARVSGGVQSVTSRLTTEHNGLGQVLNYTQSTLRNGNTTDYYRYNMTYDIKGRAYGYEELSANSNTPDKLTCTKRYFTAYDHTFDGTNTSGFVGRTHDYVLENTITAWTITNPSGYTVTGTYRQKVIDNESTVYTPLGQNAEFHKEIRLYEPDVDVYDTTTTNPAHEPDYNPWDYVPYHTPDYFGNEDIKIKTTTIDRTDSHYWGDGTAEGDRAAFGLGANVTATGKIAGYTEETHEDENEDYTGTGSDLALDLTTTRNRDQMTYHEFTDQHGGGLSDAYREVMISDADGVTTTTMRLETTYTHGLTLSMHTRTTRGYEDPSDGDVVVSTLGTEFQATTTSLKTNNYDINGQVLSYTTTTDSEATGRSVTTREGLLPGTGIGYDSFGRQYSYSETSTAYGNKTVTQRLSTNYNLMDQTITYFQTSLANGVTTSILRTGIVHDSKNRTYGYNEIRSSFSSPQLTVTTTRENTHYSWAFGSASRYQEVRTSVDNGGTWNDVTGTAMKVEYVWRGGDVSSPVDPADNPFDPLDVGITYDTKGRSYAFREIRHETDGGAAGAITIDKWSETHRAETLYYESDALNEELTDEGWTGHFLGQMQESAEVQKEMCDVDENTDYTGTVDLSVTRTTNKTGMKYYTSSSFSGLSYQYSTIVVSDDACDKTTSTRTTFTEYNTIGRATEELREEWQYDTSGTQGDELNLSKTITVTSTYDAFGRIDERTEQTWDSSTPDLEKTVTTNYAGYDGFGQWESRVVDSTSSGTGSLVDADGDGTGGDLYQLHTVATTFRSLYDTNLGIAADQTATSWSSASQDIMTVKTVDFGGYDLAGRVESKTEVKHEYDSTPGGILDTTKTTQISNIGYNDYRESGSTSFMIYQNTTPSLDIANTTIITLSFNSLGQMEQKGELYYSNLGDDLRISTTTAYGYNVNGQTDLEFVFRTEYDCTDTSNYYKQSRSSTDISYDGELGLVSGKQEISIGTHEPGKITDTRKYDYLYDENGRRVFLKTTTEEASFEVFAEGVGSPVYDVSDSMTVTDFSYVYYTDTVTTASGSVTITYYTGAEGADSTPTGWVKGFDYTASGNHSLTDITYSAETGLITGFTVDGTVITNVVFDAMNRIRSYTCSGTDYEVVYDDEGDIESVNGDEDVTYMPGISTNGTGFNMIPPLVRYQTAERKDSEEINTYNDLGQLSKKNCTVA